VAQVSGLRGLRGLGLADHPEVEELQNRVTMFAVPVTQGAFAIALGTITENANVIDRIVLDVELLDFEGTAADSAFDLVDQVATGVTAANDLEQVPALGLDESLRGFSGSRRHGQVSSQEGVEFVLSYPYHK
jgi:hypothetical protein